MDKLPNGFTAHLTSVSQNFVFRLTTNSYTDIYLTKAIKFLRIFNLNFYFGLSFVNT